MGCINSKNGNTSGNQYHSALRLGDDEVKDRIECSPMTVDVKIGHSNLRYAYLSQRGYYPDALNKPNQDCFLVCRNFMKDTNKALFAVFDGHGRDGDLCAQFARNSMVEKVGHHLKGKKTKEEFWKGITMAHYELNEQMHRAINVDDTLSGTTAISLLIVGETMYISNVGDSRAIIAQVNPQTKKLTAKALSNDQTPFRKDERERVKKAGARVLSMDQISGQEPIHENWGDVNLGEELDVAGDPPRIWSKHGEYPGTAFTRSLGDSIAEELGVFAVPEILVRKFSKNDRFIVLASDGVFEFLTNQNVCDIIQEFDDPLKACEAVVQEAYELWLNFEIRTDDITIICVYIDQDKGNDDQGIELEQVGLQESRPVRKTVSRGKKQQIVYASKKFEDEVKDININDYKIDKTPEEVIRITLATAANYLFKDISDEKLQQVIEVMQRVPVKKGDRIIRQGDTGDRFYIVDAGEFEVRVSKDPKVRAKDGGPVQHVYKATEERHPCFGELALMETIPRAASITAAADGFLWALDRPVFRKLLLGTEEAKALSSALHKCEELEFLSDSQFNKLCSTMQLHKIKFVKNHEFDSSESINKFFYVIHQGTVAKTYTDGSTETLNEYDFFGENIFNEKDHGTAILVASSDCICFVIGTAEFEEILGFSSHKLLENQLRWSARRGTIINIEVPLTFDRLDILETKFVDDLGGFSSVRIKDGKHGKDEIFCVKTTSKAKTKELKSLDMILNAKEIAVLLRLSTDSIFIPSLIKTFDDKDTYYSLYNCNIVCDLHTLFSEKLPEEDQVRHVGVCVLLALEYLHQQHIICRGLSSDLLHVTITGNIVLVNMFYAKSLVECHDQTNTLCGPTDYLSPEQVNKNNYSYSSDIWSFGVLLYDIMEGSSPFCGITEETCFDNILNHKSGLSLKFGSTTNPNFTKLIGSLLEPLPTDRLGCKSENDISFASIKKHAWFKGVDWKSYENGTFGVSSLLPLVERKIAEIPKGGYNLPTIPYKSDVNDFDRFSM